MDKPLSLIERLMSRKANELSVIDVAFVKIRFWTVVVGEKIVFS